MAAQALLFAVFHLSNGYARGWAYASVQAAGAGVVGAYYGLRARRDGGVLDACLLHAAHNLAAWACFGSMAPRAAPTLAGLALYAWLVRREGVDLQVSVL